MRRLALGVALGIALAVLVLLVPLFPAAPVGVARAADANGGFNFSQPNYSVEENAGNAVITVTRPVLESSFSAQVRYVTSGNGYDPSTNGPYPCLGGPCSAIAGQDFRSVRGVLDFPALQTSESFSVPLINLGVDTVSKTVQLALFGPSGSSPLTGPIGLGGLVQATLTINFDIPVPPAAPGNPLGVAHPVPGNPLAGARFFVDPKSESADASRQPGYNALSTIARQPGTSRFGAFSYKSPYVGNIGVAVSRYLARAAATSPGTVPLLSTYRIVYGHCGHFSDPPAEQRSYHDFISLLAQGIGSYPAVLFLEQDALITSPCLSPGGLAVRMHELSDAIDLLSRDPHLVIYVDAGAADALPYATAAKLLLRAGVSRIQGFFLNATHFDWTAKEIRYGQKIARLTGGKHFVVNTGENGQGPLVPRDRVHQGNEVLCNPPGRGLGPLPTTHTGFPYADAFEWTSNPGESGGRCVPGAPSTGAYWPAYGLGLVRRADFRVR